MENVVVTGYGTITPIGNTISDFKRNLFEGNSGANSITKFDASQFTTQIACELKKYNASLYFKEKDIHKLDLFTQYALIATKEAIEYADINSYTKLDKNRVGVIASSGVGGIATFQQEMYNYWHQKNPRYFSPYFVSKMIISNIAAHISMQYGFHGINYAVASACSSSAHAIVSAIQNIQLNKADVVVVAGSEAPIHEAGLGSFGTMRALSTNNQNPKKASRPFDKNRDGFVLGEGAGCIILESALHAQKRNAKIIAQIAGYSTNADAHHITKPLENGEMVALNMQQCLADAGLQPKQIDCINAHATSTMLGDIAEVKAIETVFGKHLDNINITAPKSIFGHLLGAAGIVESIASLLMIEEQKVSPTINLENRDEQIAHGINLTTNQTQPREIKYLMNNNFGFGGHNVSILFKKI